MKQVVATMAGTVINVLVNVGDDVQAGADVVMLESMKMEVPVTAELSGKVAEVKVNIGDFVNEGDVLVELEG
jgi:acetyl-CoA carboxylase biotin carboxyl carrier protein